MNRSIYSLSNNFGCVDKIDIHNLSERFIYTTTISKFFSYQNNMLFQSFTSYQ